MDTNPDEKKGFLSRLGEALFVTTEAADPAEAGIAVAPREDGPAPGAEEGRLTAEDEKLLTEIGAEVAAAGPLLGQFLDLAGELREIVPQESASFQAALKALAKTGGGNRSDLLAAIEQQLAALAKQKEAFAHSVAGKLQTVQASGKKAETIRARINELQKNIRQLEEEEQQLFAQMTAEEKLVRTAQARFETVLRTLERDIHGKRDKIRNYLPETAEKDAI